MTIVLIVHTKPVEDPITIEEAMEFLRIDSDVESNLLGTLIKAATRHAEEFMRRSIVERTYELVLDTPAMEIYLPRPPLLVLSSITTYDETGLAVVVPLTDVMVTSGDRPKLTFLTLPTTRSVNGIVIEYTAGYGGAEDVPEEIKLGIKYIVGEFFENRGRETAMPNMARMALQPFRMMKL